MALSLQEGASMEQSIHAQAYKESTRETAERCDHRADRLGRGLPPPCVARALCFDAMCVAACIEPCGAASGWRLTWVVQALQASTEPLGTAGTMSELVLSAKKALIGATGPHVYRYRSTLCALSKEALVGGRGGPKIAKPLSVAR